jgi:hypothetical protein
MRKKQQHIFTLATLKRKNLKIRYGNEIFKENEHALEGVVTFKLHQKTYYKIL